MSSHYDSNAKGDPQQAPFKKQEHSRFLFVENLHPDTTEDELIKEFAPYGSIEFISKKPNATTADITYRYVAEAGNARYNTNKRIFKGQQLRVTYSKGVPSKVLWLGSIRKDANSQTELEKVMAPYGKVVHIKCLPKSNCAFVTFESLVDAMAAHNDLPNISIKGWNPRVGYSAQGSKDDFSEYHERGDDSGRQVMPCGMETSKRTCYLWVYGVTDDSDKERLQAECGPAALKIRIFKTVKSAYIETDSTKDSESLIDKISQKFGWAVNFAEKPPTRFLWVGSRTSTTRDEFHRAFSKYGDIEQIRVLGGRTVFIDYYHTENAVHAAWEAKEIVLNKSVGAQVDFSAGPKDSYAPPPDPYDSMLSPSPSLYISFPKLYLPAEADPQLRKEFGKFGKIYEINTFYNKNYAFVTFHNSDDAARAKEALSGRLFGDPNIQIRRARDNFHLEDSIRGRSRSRSPNRRSRSRERRSRSRDKDKNTREREKEKDSKDTDKEKDKDRDRDRERDRDRDRDRDRERRRSKSRERERPRSRERRSRSRDRDRDRPSRSEPDAKASSAHKTNGNTTSATPDKKRPTPADSSSSRANEKQSGFKEKESKESRYAAFTSSMVRHSAPLSPAKESFTSVGGFSIAKSGVVVCNTLGFAAEDQIANLRQLLPSKLDITSRTDEAVFMEFIKAANSINILLLPESEASIKPYDELIQYLKSRQKVGIIQLNSGYALYLRSSKDSLPPNVIYPECLIGHVVLVPQAPLPASITAASPTLGAAGAVGGAPFGTPAMTAANPGMPNMYMMMLMQMQQQQQQLQQFQQQQQQLQQFQQLQQQQLQQPPLPPSHQHR